MEFAADSIVLGELLFTDGFVKEKTTSSLFTPRHDYLSQVRTDLTTRFRDQYGYVVGTIDGKPKGDGEATLNTALAAIAVATSNYRPDDWDEQNANSVLSSLLTVLLEKSWGDPDRFDGLQNPIRHPDLYDYDMSGHRIRHSPLTKDSFGACINAAFTAYVCVHSSENVREIARRLAEKWTTYLVARQWRTHSNYIIDEFVPEGKFYKNIYGEPFDGSTPEQRRVKFKGPDAYILVPTEVYGLQNAASKLGIFTSGWNVWSDYLPNEIVVAIKQTVAEVAAPYVGAAFGRGIRYIIDRLVIAIPYNVQIGPAGWKFNHISGALEIGIPAATKDRIQSEAEKVIIDVIREGVRLDNLWKGEIGEVIGLLIDRILDFFPDSLDTNSWRSVLTGAIQEVIPWLTGTIWIEGATFIGVLGWLSAAPDPSYTSYSLWSYANELENRPDIMTIVSPFMRAFFKRLRDTNNSNGLWAWIVSDSAEVERQLKIFEKYPVDYWSSFAYGSKKFEDWLQVGKPPERGGPAFPRIDYLLLMGLSKRGAPSDLPNVAMKWWTNFANAAKGAALRLENFIKSEFDRLGQFSQVAIDAQGRALTSTWNKLGEFSEEILKAGVLLSKTVYDKDATRVLFFERLEGGKWSESYWLRPTEKYIRSIWQSAEAGAQILERYVWQLDGKWEESYWSRSTEKFWRGLWPTKDATALVEKFVWQLDGKWEQSYWGRAAEKYWRGLWRDMTESCG